MQDVVIGIDASTTAVKAIAFDKAGRELFQARAAYPLATPLPGHFEQDAEDWWQALVGALARVASEVGSARIAALAIAHQRESFTLIDADGAPLIPAILWLDERARAEVARLSAMFGREAIRDWTGKPPDPTPALYAVAWLAAHRPEALEAAAALVDVDGFLIHRLTGRLVTSTASADPLGLLATAAGEWHAGLADAVGLKLSQLPELVAPGMVAGRVSPQAARLTGLAAGLPVVAGAGDGQAMGLGMGVVGEGKAYLSLGSGVVSGMYSARYVTSDGFRTLTSPSGEGFMLETVLRSGMQLADWVVRLTGAASAGALEAQARTLPPGSDNLLLLPYWAGVMSPYWDEAARGAVFGLSLAHGPAHLYRAALEGIAFEQRVATGAMERDVGFAAEALVAAGGGTQSALLMNIMAAALERPLSVSPVQEAGALGAAMLAAAAVGWHADSAAASLAMAAPPTRQVLPDPALVAAYRKRQAIYADLYHATRDVHARLAALG